MCLCQLSGLVSGLISEVLFRSESGLCPLVITGGWWMRPELWPLRTVDLCSPNRFARATYGFGA